MINVVHFTITVFFYKFQTYKRIFSTKTCAFNGRYLCCNVLMVRCLCVCNPGWYTGQRNAARRRPAAHKLTWLGEVSRSRRRDPYGEAYPLHFGIGWPVWQFRVEIRQQLNFCVRGCVRAALPIHRWQIKSYLQLSEFTVPSSIQIQFAQSVHT